MKKVNWKSVLGALLIMPSIIFIILLLDYKLIDTDPFFSPVLTTPSGKELYSTSERGEMLRRENIDEMTFNSSIPIYLGLLALSGAYLIINNTKGTGD